MELLSITLGNFCVNKTAEVENRLGRFKYRKTTVERHDTLKFISSEYDALSPSERDVNLETYLKLFATCSPPDQE